MSTTTHYDWLNRNSLRSFPIVENDGTLLPCDLIADIRLLNFTGSMSDSIYVRSVFVGPKIVSVFLGSASTVFGSATFVRGGGMVTSRLSSLVPGGTMISGSVSCGSAFLLKDEPYFPLDRGMHSFDTSLPIEARCIINIPGGLPLSSVRTTSGLKLSSGVKLNPSGDLIADVETYTDASGLPSTRVTLSLSHLEDYASVCEKASNPSLCSTPVYKINTVEPDSNGRIFLNMTGFTSVASTSGSILPTVLGSLAGTCVRPEVPASDGSMSGDDNTGITISTP